MSQSESLLGLSHYLDCQKKKVMAEGGLCEAQRTHHSFVTISREAGAGGITIGRKVASLLNEHKKAQCACPWTVFDDNLVKTVLKEHSLPERIADYMPENRISEVKDILEEILELHPSQIALIRQTRETILHLAHMGHAIIVGRGANVVTARLQHGLHVRIIASRSKRLSHVEAYYGFDKKTAIDFVHNEDQGRKEYLKSNFNKDIDDPRLYDLVINTDRVSYDSAAKLIVKASSCI